MPNEKESNSPDRARLRAEINAVVARRTTAADLIFDRTAPEGERVKAAHIAGPADSQERAERLFALVTDAKESADVRAATLLSQVNLIGLNVALIDEVLALLRDRDTPTPVRHAALTVLQTLSFSSREFQRRRAEHLDVLRSLIEDPDRELSRRAIQYLALMGDEIVQQRLVQSLEQADETLVAPEAAIQMLSYNLHANHFPILRRIAREAPNLRSKKEALRNLGADPASADHLADVMANPDEDPEVRHIAAVSLAELQPARALEGARTVVLDARAHAGLRTAMLNTIIHSGVKERGGDGEFAEKLAAMPKRGLSSQFRGVYARFLQGNRRPSK